MPRADYSGTMTKRRFALVFVAAAALALALAARVPATPAVDGLQLRVATGMEQRLVGDPVGTVVRADALRAVGGANGALARVLLADQTRRPVTLRVRALPSARDLDDTLRVSVTVGHRRIACSTLGRLRGFTKAVRLAPGEPVELGVRVWLPARTPARAYVGRTLDVVLELSTEPVITG
jgi:hypothetical protein